MATKSEMDALADKLARSLKLDVGGKAMDMERMVYTANPMELEYLRKQVLKEQNLCDFDDEGLVKRFVEATKRKMRNGSGDTSSSISCFEKQIMMPTIVDAFDQLPTDLKTNWMCIVCPEGSRVLVVASHKSTRVYDIDGTWICEHDTHLPGGSPSNISKVDGDDECTILDCLYNNEQEVYYVVDILCWKGLRYYKYETNVRITTALEKVKNLPSLKQVTQTNPFRFYSLPVSYVCQKNAICSTIARASFTITGLLFYHKRALYLPGLTPLGIWLETSYIPYVLDIQVHKLEYNATDTVPGQRDWKKNRYEMKPEQCSYVHNSAYATSYQTDWAPGGYGMRGPFPYCDDGYREYNMGYNQQRYFDPRQYYGQEPRQRRGMPQKKKYKPQTENTSKKKQDTPEAPKGERETQKDTAESPKETENRETDTSVNNKPETKTSNESAKSDTAESLSEEGSIDTDTSPAETDKQPNDKTKTDATKPAKDKRKPSKGKQKK